MKNRVGVQRLSLDWNCTSSYHRVRRRGYSTSLLEVNSVHLCLLLFEYWPFWFIPGSDLLVLVSSVTLPSQLASNSLDVNYHLKSNLNFNNLLYPTISLPSSSLYQSLLSGQFSAILSISPLAVISPQSPLNILFDSALSFSVQSHRGPYLNLTEVPANNQEIINKTSPSRNPSLTTIELNQNNNHSIEYIFINII